MGLLTPRPTSPAEGLHFVENFVGNGVITTDLIGQNKWTTTAIGNAGTLSYLTTILATDPPAGGMRMLTAGTADGDGDAVHMLAANARFAASEGGGGFAFRFRYPGISGNVIAANNFYIGVHTSVTATVPTDGITVHSDGGVLTLRADSADHGDLTQAFASGTTLTSGTTAVLDVAHQIEVHWSGENGQGGPRLVEAFCDNVPVGSLYAVIDDDENATPAIVHWQDAGTAQTFELDVHWFEHWQFLDYPTAPAV